MCIFANEGGPKSKSSRKETPLKIQKYKEKHVSGKNLEKMFSAPTPTPHPVGLKDQQLPEFLSSTKSFVDFQTCITAGRGAVKSPDCPNFLFLSEQKLQFCSYPPSTFNTSFLPHNILHVSHNSRYMFSCLHAICLCLCDDLLFNF